MPRPAVQWVGDVDGKASARRRREKCRDRGGEAMWRRSEGVLYCPIQYWAILYGCRQGTILAPLSAWRGNYSPAAGSICLGTFWIEDATSGSRRGHLSSDATEGGAAESGSSGRGELCSTERSRSSRAGERFVGERLLRGERKRPWPNSDVTAYGLPCSDRPVTSRDRAAGSPPGLAGGKQAKSKQQSQTVREASQIEQANQANKRA
jgi:hypothetical protein